MKKIQITIPILFLLLIGCPQDTTYVFYPLEGKILDNEKNYISNVKIISSNNGYTSSNILVSSFDSTFSDNNGSYLLNNGLPKEKESESGCTTGNDNYETYVDFMLIYIHSDYDTLVVGFISDSTSLQIDSNVINNSDTLVILSDNKMVKEDNVTKIFDIILTKK